MTRDEILALAGEPNLWTYVDEYGNLRASTLDPAHYGYGGLADKSPHYTAEQLLAVAKPLEAEIARLKREDFSHERLQNDSLKLANKVLHEQLASAQADNLRLREHVDELIELCTPSSCECDPAVGYQCRACHPVSAVKAAKQALSSQPDTSAIAEVVARAGEVMRGRCAVRAVETGDYMSVGKHVAGAIRALPGVTLEDLISLATPTATTE